MSDHHTKDLELTNPTTINDGLADPLQIKVVKSPDGGTQDDPKGTVGEGMHGSIYASKNDAECIEENGGERRVVARG